jgi:hypothetical protein
VKSLWKRVKIQQLGFGVEFSGRTCALDCIRVCIQSPAPKIKVKLPYSPLLGVYTKEVSAPKVCVGNLIPIVTVLGVVA